MEIRFFVVSLACLSCLVPPALGMKLVGKAAAIGAAKGAIIGGIKGAAIGAGIGLAAKAAAALVTKKALMSIALKAAALKGSALLAAKKAAVKGIGALAVKGITSALGKKSNVVQLLPAVTGILQSRKVTAVAREMSPIVYRIISAPRTFGVPVQIVSI